ncbi:MAG: Fe-S cluster assembly protein SufD [Candidatus Omnitrophota bacterium]
MNTYSQTVLEKPVEKEAASPSWLWEVRRKAYDRFKKIGFPTTRLESWRYINLEPILGAAYRAQEGAARPFSFVKGEDTGVELLDWAAAFRKDEEFLKRHLAVSAGREENPFVLVNTFSFKDAAVVRFPDHLTLDAPIHLRFVLKGSASGELLYPRVLITAGKCVRAKVIVEFTDEGSGRFFSNAVSEVHIGEGACLDYLQIQRAGGEAVQFLSNRFYLKAYATLNALSFAQGGAVTRNEASVDFGGEGGFASLNGLAVLKGQSQIFNHAAAHHDVPRCKSRQFYKTILGDKSKSEFNSLVSVAKDARKSDSNQMNRNLLLSDFAESHSRPQLRIDNDDVICVHGSATGQLEADELFYLRTRGLAEKDARFIMTYGFAREVVEEIHDGALREEIDRAVQEDLKRMVRG